MFTVFLNGVTQEKTIGDPMKYLLILLMMCAPCYAQEVKKDKKGRTVIVLDEKQSKECEKYGCLITPLNQLEQVVIDIAKHMCGQRI
jgi:hypothetical protein